MAISRLWADGAKKEARSFQIRRMSGNLRLSVGCGCGKHALESIDPAMGFVDRDRLAANP